MYAGLESASIAWRLPKLPFETPKDTQSKEILD
jgi:hypothetical protein